MALDRLLPVSTTPGAVTGNSYMDAVQEEVTGLWDRATITLTGISGTNTILATATPALTGALTGDMNVILKPAATNTSAVTLNINSGGAVAVVDAEGNALVAGALRINGNYFLHYDSGISKWVVVNYTPAVAVANGLILIKTQVAAAVATIDFVNGVSGVVFDDTYDNYQFEVAAALPATDDVEFHVLVGTGGGPTYQVTNYNYNVIPVFSGTAGTIITSTTGTELKTTTTGAGNKISSTAGEGGLTGTFKINDPDGAFTSQITFTHQYIAATSSVFFRTEGGGNWDTTTPLTAIRFKFSSGNITSGRFSLYGMTKV